MARIVSSVMKPAHSRMARALLVGPLFALVAAAGQIHAQEAAKPPVPPPPPAPGQEAKPTIPEDLLGDEHLREEFGVNQFTTPSIRKLFEMLDGLGKLSYDNLKRPITRRTPTDRIMVSMGLGTLIADGFLIVQCEKAEAIADVGRALLTYAKVLSAGSRMNRHTQSLLDHSVEGKWDDLRAELAATQADVEAEMVQLRDVDIAHLVSLGGWLRAFEIATRSVADNYTEDKSRQIGRHDIAEYYLHSLENLEPAIQGNVSLQAVRKGLTELLPLIDVPEGKALTADQMKLLSEKAASLSHIVTDSMKG